MVIAFPMAFSQEARAASLAVVQVGNYLASCSNSLAVSVVGKSFLCSHLIGCCVERFHSGNLLPSALEFGWLSGVGEDV